MATHAVFHGGGNFFCDDFALRYRAVAMGAINPRLAMPRVAEENKVRDRVNLPGRKRSGLIPQRGQTLNLPAVLLHRAVARHALAYRRERRLLSGLDSHVAILAFDLQRSMQLVAEVDRLVGACRPGYGKENATSESE
jgi:hypothetical protein